MKDCLTKCSKILSSKAAIPTAVIAFVVSIVTALSTGIKEVTTMIKPKEETAMKKSTIITVIVVLAAVAGALAAAYFYLARRERELNEYEELLFSEDLTDDLSIDPESYDAVAE